jgi:hypothetical protein
MKPEWDDALAAYDEQVEVLEGLRNDYIAFLRASFEALGGRLLEARGMPWIGDFSPKADPLPPNVSWFARPREGSPVGLWLWAGAPSGAPRSTLRMVLSIEMEPGYGKSEGDERKKRWALLAERARATAPALPGAARNAAKDHDTEGDVVWVHNTPLPETTSDATFDALSRFANVAAEIDESIQLCAWLGDCLAPLTKGAPPEGWAGARWESETLKPWEGGWYVQVNGQGDDDFVWVAARPPGELLLGHTRAGIHAELCKELDARGVDFDPDQRHAVILEVGRATALWKARTSGAVREPAVEALRAFFQLDGGGTPR